MSDISLNNPLTLVAQLNLHLIDSLERLDPAKVDTLLHWTN